MLRAGDSFDRYTIEAPIGEGGMGAVYRAHDTRLDRKVALKIIADGAAPSPDADARLVREARAAAALDHPNVVSIFDVGEVEGAPYIVMELVSGRALRELVGDASVPIARRVAWLADVARALAAAHRRGLVHRDVKPENVMVRDDGVVKVLDFGIARRAEGGAVDGTAPTEAPPLPALTREGVKVGTPVYMAPEQIRGEPLDGRTDQFAWGVVAFELLAGKLPWRGGGDPLALVASIMTDEPSRDALAKAGAAPELTAVVARATAKRREDRYASMDDLLRDLAPADDARPPSRVLAVQPPAKTPTELARYSTAEVAAILSRAVEQQEAMREDTRLGFDDLLAAAREVGVSPEVLREASRGLGAGAREASEEQAAREAWMHTRRTKFFRHLGAWVLVSVAVVLNGIVERHFGDHLTLLLMWAVGVGVHGLSVVFTNADDWEKHKRRREPRSQRRARREAARAPEPRVLEGADLLLQTGALLRRRVAVPPPAVRVADDAAAEREAMAADEAARVEPARARPRG